LVEKWIPPSRSEIAKIGVKTEGILGVKEWVVHGVDHDVTNCNKLFKLSANSRLYSTMMWQVVVHIILYM
jgi:hypothetical protein